MTEPHAIAFSPAVRMLAGPAWAAGAEGLREHLARLGMNPLTDARDTVGELEASGLLGRGGAGFPVGTKWRSVAGRAAGIGGACSSTAPRASRSAARTRR